MTALTNSLAPTTLLPLGTNPFDEGGTVVTYIVGQDVDPVFTWASVQDLVEEDITDCLHLIEVEWMVVLDPQGANEVITNPEFVVADMESLLISTDNLANAGFYTIFY